MKERKVAITLLVLAIMFTAIGSTFAYFSASVTRGTGIVSGQSLGGTNGAVLSLTAEKITWNNTQASSNDLVPADITTSIAQAAINAKCEATNGDQGASAVYTGCHLYRIIATSSSNMDSATLKFSTFTLTDVTATSMWHYAMWDTTDAATSTSYTLGSNIAVATSTGEITSANEKTVFTSSMTANTPKVYYLLIYVENAEIVQNSGLSVDVTGSYTGEFTLSSTGGDIARACFDQNGTCSVSNTCPSSTVPLNNSVPNAPVLDDGLIPVTIANDGTVTAISSNNANWYNYSNKQWANAVLTTSTNRSTYQSIASGNTASTTIPSNEILAYFVWIPRYKYAIPEALNCGCIPNVNEADYLGCYDPTSESLDDLLQFIIDENYASDMEEALEWYEDWHDGYINWYNEENNPDLELELITDRVYNYPRTIDIVFEAANATKSNGTAVGTSYYTHPAFTFGSEELPGFWVGKFEATGDGTTPTILPNTYSLRHQNVSTQFATSLNFAGGTQSGSGVTFAGNNTYGVTSTADSHMMKNSEWGAVAYLSHSNYGIDEEIRINNYCKNDQTLTGCGANTANAASSTICGITYGSASAYPQSTTGNISGVFDMSGGAHEYVMGHWSDNLSTPSYEQSSFSTLPASKYIDIYPSNTFTRNYNTNMTFCTLATCGGHALYETANWYGDYAAFVDSDHPWFIRGGYGDVGVDAGVWEFNAYGGVSSGSSWRGVFVAR